ncbi:hypothetical protein CPU12_01045 [Malaciobacter molluscorum LMG 25693]|uniref:Outer membrane porin, OprD family n=1 Tax=Malaciobacter molluscorum LMG 25693 TaxID=870501 RepID=A0A2G1DLK5_9BACT|nr:OprD family outer membrane porin [Malaciobacter molluscorum]AXX92166.1 outer membrane porin, OprD family [Malaciobacter molluscorum LMG 25693]PHO19395.1 hypothetical protein CPU12_01045 [Malaciobacter molluscorum LMG 25693]
MKKVTKKSLITILALATVSTYSFGSDTLVEAFSNGKVKGELKSYYFDENYDSATSSDNNVWVNGALLNYVTDSLKGFKLGATFQTSHVGSIDDSANKQATKMDASGSVLSEAYLEYKISNTKFKLGRQFISLPLIKGSGSRMIKESFEGYFITNTDIPHTLISLGKVTKYQTRTDSVTRGKNAATFTNDDINNGDVGGFNKIGTHGAISLYLKNDFLKNLPIQIHYVDFIDEVKDLYIDAKYKFGSDYKPFVAVQYYNSNYDESSRNDSSMFGYKIGATLFGIDFHTSYTTTDNKGNVIRGIGEAATASFTSSTSTTGNYTAGTDSWQIGAKKKFGNFSAKLTYTNSDAILEKNDLEQKYIGLKYKFKGAFKNLALSTEYTIFDYGKGSESKDKNELRAKLIYSF